jgi:signal transduction histidine kinase
MSPRDRSSSTWLRRTFERPGVLGGFLVVATLGVSSALAWQAVRAADLHRSAVESALAHHASTAAWRFARGARLWVGYGMDRAADTLQHEVAKQDKLPGPDVLKRVLAEKYCDCMSAGFGRTFMRVAVERDSVLTLIGEPLSERAKDDLREAMLVLARDGLMRVSAPRWRVLAPGVPRLNRGSDVALIWRTTDKWKKTRAVYGMIVESEQIERPLKGALDEAEFFPPDLVSKKAAAELVHLEVAGPNGVRLFSVGPETRESLGTDTLGTTLGDMLVTASIHPSAAKLLAGGVPTSRVVTIVALLVLALVMGGAAALLLRREHRLTVLREDFVSGVSHELRTPLTHIRMLSELLETDGFKSQAERERAVNVIHRESLRLTNLVDNILEFTRMRRAAPVLAPGRVALGDVLREVGESLGPLLEAQGNKLEVVANADVEVRGDRDAVSRVLRNLVENAVKYGPVAQTIRMTLTPDSTNGHARVTVDDEGPGIPTTERQNIWQPYYRLDRDRNAPAGGSGLGLSVVADVVRMLGGTVSVADAPGRGARFIVDLPRAT